MEKLNYDRQFGQNFIFFPSFCNFAIICQSRDEDDDCWGWLESWQGSKIKYQSFWKELEKSEDVCDASDLLLLILGSLRHSAILVISASCSTLLTYSLWKLIPFTLKRKIKLNISGQFLTKNLWPAYLCGCLIWCCWQLSSTVASIQSSTDGIITRKERIIILIHEQGGVFHYKK